MLVSHGQRFIYLKTRKTAGTSVIRFLEPFCVAGGALQAPGRSRPAMESAAGIIGYFEPDPNVTTWWTHMPAALVKQRLGVVWDTYTKVCCIRNPYDKVFSYFWWRHQDFASTKVSDLEIKAAFRSWVLADDDLALDREMYTIEDGSPCLDYYIRFECLASSLAGLCEILDIPFAPADLGWRKGGIRPLGLSFKDFYDRVTTDRVLSVYAKEFEWFGYREDFRD